METNIQEWFRAFYATSDDGSAHQKYAKFYTQDATLIRLLSNATKGNLVIGNLVDRGTDILQLRTGIWSKVSRRKQTYTYYSSPECSDMYLLEGYVVYGLKTGIETTVKWVAQAEFEGRGSDGRLAFDQAFLERRQ